MSRLARCLRCIKHRQYHTSIRTQQQSNQSISQSINQPFDESELATPTWSVVALLESKSHTDHSINHSKHEDSYPVVTEELIKKLSQLCYLNIPDTNDQSVNPLTNQPNTNIHAMRDSVQSMIGWMSTINHLDTEGIEPIFTPLQIMDEYMTVSINQSNDQSINHSAIEINRLRQDKVELSTHVNITELAPHSDRGFIAVPKVVDIDE